MSARFTGNENPDEPKTVYDRWIITCLWRPEGNSQDTAKIMTARSAEEARSVVSHARTAYGAYPHFTLMVDVETVERTFEQGKPVVRVVDRRPQLVRSDPGDVSDGLAAMRATLEKTGR